ncbi:hypothetical protein RSOLAG1IB_04040 [Rhizoctonia solani AG-1 IB]|uniref:Uncharacterized protein n=1 Tax=Thanatephorus cucumeris (strain AG1-IB / isolate 7/3/14) TaxID=1108050 RepID=A0A0B7FS44_THACB|nr:hypothetical protein RSOLAG1IB_04040 [Rhizoctonia solani AG-1 IB]
MPGHCATNSGSKGATEKIVESPDDLISLRLSASFITIKNAALAHLSAKALTCDIGRFRPWIFVYLIRTQYTDSLYCCQRTWHTDRYIQ